MSEHDVFDFALGLDPAMTWRQYRGLDRGRAMAAVSYSVFGPRTAGFWQGVLPWPIPRILH
ncbi:hypothetical protein ACIBEK_00045 [Nocardia fusca]|uniref:hypothetical protein n=1 Tax=Nocardia fusca TaxID=941183 RepID=UPI0037BBC169